MASSRDPDIEKLRHMISDLRCSNTGPIDIDEFIKLYGQTKYDQLYEYITENNLGEEFIKYIVTGDKTGLLRFGIKYGIFDIIEFLYVHKNVSYDINFLTEFNKVIESETDANGAELRAEGISCGIHVETMDRFTHNRNSCINWLLEAKKYSRLTTIGKKQIYILNNKYKSKFI
jgi:hypothetical protein